MLYNQTNLEQIPHFRFRSYLSQKTLGLLKGQVLRVMRDQMDEPLVKPFLNWIQKPNEIFLHADYSLIEFDLPRDFDTLFWKDSEHLIETAVHIPFSIINGLAPTQKISIGHKYVCLMQFTGDTPSVLKDLPEVNDIHKGDQELVLVNKVDFLYKRLT